MTAIQFQKPVLLLVGFAVSAGIAFFYYYRDKKFEHVKKAVVYLMAFLRFLSLFLLFIILANPLVKTNVNTRQKPIVIFLQDNSKSIALALDTSQLTDYLDNVNNLVKKLRTKYDVRFFSFSDSLRQDKKIDFSGNYTNISLAINDINQRFVNQNIGAIILATDGIYNQGFDPGTLANSSTVPIYTIVLGDTIEYADLKINNVKTNSIVYLHEKFPVQVDIGAVHATGKKIQVKVLLSGKLVATKSVTVNKDFFRATVNFVIKPTSPGKKIITVTISRLPNERNVLNNHATAVINVIDSRQKILVLSRFPHPDIAALTRILASVPTYKTDYIPFDKFKGNLTDYDLIVLYQIPDDKTNTLRLAKLLETAHKPILFICGPKTNLYRLKNLGIGIDFEPVTGSYDRAQATVNNDFDFFFPDKGLDKSLQDLPPLIVPYINFQQVDARYVLLWQKINNIKTTKPLLMFIPTAPVNNNKIGILWGEGLWQWRMTEYRNTRSFKQIDHIIIQTIQFLMTKEQARRFNVKVKPIIDQNQEVIFTAELYDKAFNPITRPEVKLTVIDSTGNAFNYVFERANDYYFLNIGKMEQGVYKYAASCQIGSEKFSDHGSFVVRAINLEAINLKANTGLLDKISSFSGGRLYFPNQMDQLADQLVNSQSMPQIIITQTRIQEAIKYIILLFAIVLLLTIEWILRKYHGNL